MMGWSQRKTNAIHNKDRFLILYDFIAHVFLFLKTIAVLLLFLGASRINILFHFCFLKILIFQEIFKNYLGVQLHFRCTTNIRAKCHVCKLSFQYLEFHRNPMGISEISNSPTHTHTPTHTHRLQRACVRL